MLPVLRRKQLRAVEQWHSFMSLRSTAKSLLLRAEEAYAATVKSRAANCIQQWHSAASTSIERRVNIGTVARRRANAVSAHAFALWRKCLSVHRHRAAVDTATQQSVMILHGVDCPSRQLFIQWRVYTAYSRQLRASIASLSLKLQRLSPPARAALRWTFRSVTGAVSAR